MKIIIGESHSRDIFNYFKVIFIIIIPLSMYMFKKSHSVVPDIFEMSTIT